jgi:predicted amidophosphoribosyltransferase
VCDGCGEPLGSWRAAGATRGPLQAGARCGVCSRRPRPVDRARAIGAYDDRLREIIHAFKYDHRRTLARGLGALMRRHGAELIGGADLAVPVPLHWRRRLDLRGRRWPASSG